MNENVIDTLQIKVTGDSKSAVSSLDKLINTLDRIKTVTSGGNKGLTGIDRHLAKISAACDKINAGALSKIYKLADGLRNLNEVGNVKISSKFADRILDLGAAVECLKDVDMSKLTELSAGLRDLNSVGKVNIPTPKTNAVTTPTTAESPLPDFSGAVQINPRVVSDTENTIDTITEKLADMVPEGVITSRLTSILDLLKSIGRVSAKIGSTMLQIGKRIGSSMLTPFKAVGKLVGGIKEKIGNLFRLLKKRTLYRAMNFVISSITKGFSEGTKHVYEYSKAINGKLKKSLDKMATSGLYLKNSLGAMVSPLLNMLAPAIDTIVDKFVEMLNVVNQALATMSGSSTWTKAIKYPIEYSDETKKATKANEKLKKSILGFDEINPLHDNSNDSGSSGKEQEDYSLMFEEKKVGDIANTFKKLFGDIFKPFKQAWETEGQATIDSFKKKFNSIKTLITTIGDSFKEVWSNGTGQTTLETILRIFQNINTCISNIAITLTNAWTANDNGTRIVQNLWDIFNKLLGTVEKFYGSTAKWLGSLDLTPIFTSFANLTDKLKPLVDLISDGLLKAYEKVLQPIAKWVIEKAAPASIDALSAALEALTAVLDPVLTGLESIWDALQPVVKWIEDTVVDAINLVKDAFKKLADTFNKNGGDIKSILKDVGDALKTFWNGIKPIIDIIKTYVGDTVKNLTSIFSGFSSGSIKQLKGFIDFVKGIFTLDFKKAWNGLKEFFSGWGEKIKTIFSGIWTAIKNIFKGAWTAIQAVWNGAKAFFKGVWEGIKTVFGKVGSFFASIFLGAWNGIKAIWNGVKGFFKGIWKGIKAVFSGVGSFFRTIFAKAVSGVKGVWNGIKGFFAKIWGWIKAPFKAAASFFKDAFAKVVSGVKGAWNGIKAFFAKIWSWISAPFKKVGGWFKNIFTNAVRGLKGCWNGIKEWASNIWGYIAAPFKKAYAFFKDVFEQVAKKIKEIWKDIKDFILEIWETIKRIVGSVWNDDTKVKVRAEYERQHGKVSDAEWDKIWYSGSAGGGKFASGGLVNEGQMFIAREAGPELVGTIGNRNAVVNNDQIVASVSQGVADANAEQNMLLREEISILRKILEKDYGSGSAGGTNIINEINRYNRRSGKTIIPVGV